MLSSFWACPIAGRLDPEEKSGHKPRRQCVAFSTLAILIPLRSIKMSSVSTAHALECPRNSIAPEFLGNHD